jgi:hypothetical protein
MLALDPGLAPTAARLLAKPLESLETFVVRGHRPFLVALGQPPLRASLRRDTGAMPVQAF